MFREICCCGGAHRQNGSNANGMRGQSQTQSGNCGDCGCGGWFAGNSRNPGQLDVVDDDLPYPGQCILNGNPISIVEYVKFCFVMQKLCGIMLIVWFSFPKVYQVIRTQTSQTNATIIFLSRIVCIYFIKHIPIELIICQHISQAFAHRARCRQISITRHSPFKIAQTRPQYEARTWYLTIQYNI